MRDVKSLRWIFRSSCVLAACLVLQGCGGSRWEQYTRVHEVQSAFKTNWTDRRNAYAQRLGMKLPADAKQVAGEPVAGAERAYYEAALAEIDAFAEFRQPDVVLSAARTWLAERRKTHENALREMNFSQAEVKQLSRSARKFERTDLPESRVSAFAKELGALEELGRISGELIVYHLAYTKAFREDQKTVPPAAPPMDPGMLNAIISGAQAGARIGSGVK